MKNGESFFREKYGMKRREQETKTCQWSSPRMILRNHTYLKVYKCWRILPILKTPTIK